MGDPRTTFVPINHPWEKLAGHSSSSGKTWSTCYANGARFARAHYDIPCIIITALALGKGLLIYSWLEYRMASERHVRRIFASRAPLSPVRTRERRFSSFRRGEESIRGRSRAAWYAETRPRRAYGRTKKVFLPSFFSIDSIFPDAPRIRLANHKIICVELIMKFGNLSTIRDMTAKIRRFTLHEIKIICGKFKNLYKMVRTLHFRIIY